MKHHQKHYRNIAGFVTLSGLVLGLVLAGQYEPAEAIAGDDKVAAAQLCVPIDDDDTIDEDDALILFDRVVTTTATKSEPQRFICPLIRDILAGDLDRVFVSIENVEESAPGTEDDDTACCVYSFDVTGDEVDSNCERADEDEETQTIEIDGIESEDNGYYVVTCDLREEDEAIYRIRTSES
jgi:hypothetical protein